MASFALSGVSTELASRPIPGSPSLWRRAWYRTAGRQQRLERPVISVGNLAAGGRGKTPVVEHLARMLAAAGERPAVLSRGYGRLDAPPGAVVVSDGANILAGVELSGDEPLMLARALPGVPVVVSEDRRIAGALAERHLGATVHLLDDGFQHLALWRDVDLVVLAPSDLWARAFPFGPLRESARALETAGALLAEDGATLVRWPSIGAARFTVTRSLQAPVSEGRRWAPTFGPVVAFAGIARPQRFVDDLTAAGWTVTEAVTFPDHHRYRPRDVARVAAAVGRTDAAGIVTTAKDAVRLPAEVVWPAPIAVAALRASVEPADAFRAWLLDRLAEARR